MLHKTWPLRTAPLCVGMPHKEAFSQESITPLWATATPTWTHGHAKKHPPPLLLELRISIETNVNFPMPPYPHACMYHRLCVYIRIYPWMYACIHEIHLYIHIKKERESERERERERDRHPTLKPHSLKQLLGLVASDSTRALQLHLTARAGKCSTSMPGRTSRIQLTPLAATHRRRMQESCTRAGRRSHLDCTTVLKQRCHPNSQLDSLWGWPGRVDECFAVLWPRSSEAAPQPRSAAGTSAPRKWASERPEKWL